MKKTGRLIPPGLFFGITAEIVFFRLYKATNLCATISFLGVWMKIFAVPATNNAYEFPRFSLLFFHVVQRFSFGPFLVIIYDSILKTFVKNDFETKIRYFITVVWYAILEWARNIKSLCKPLKGGWSRVDRPDPISAEPCECIVGTMKPCVWIIRESGTDSSLFVNI